MAYIGRQGELVTRVVISNLKGKVDSFDKLPDNAANGDLYIIDQSDKNNAGKGFIKTDSDGWVDLGPIRGERGEQGVPGPIGSILSTEITRNIDINGNSHSLDDNDWSDYKGAPGSTDVYEVKSSDGGSIEIKVYNGNDGTATINDNYALEAGVWSSKKTKAEILKNRPQIPNVVAAMIFQ